MRSESLSRGIHCVTCVVALTALSAGCGTCRSALTDDTMTQITGGWTTDTRCTLPSVFIGIPPDDGNTCHASGVPDFVCAGECAHTLWGCCWDPVAGRCHAAFAVTGGRCARKHEGEGWECRNLERQCDGGDPYATCCWHTEIGERTGATCYEGDNPGEQDCYDHGYWDCSREDCEQQLMEQTP